MKHTIVEVEQNSIAEELGIEPGDMLISINGEEIQDIIDYEYLTAQEELTLRFEDPSGRTLEASVEKETYETLGLRFETGLMSKIRSCKNHCIFCFIDQLPPHARHSLCVKDDDWRLSLIMGNYISLTNISDAEFDRILKRKVSPLYISVHATDPVIRRRMMCNPNAGNLMLRLTAMKQAGLQAHCQIVLCPDVNDGAILDRTVRDLYSLYPGIQSAAVVPVGLTKFREKLYPLKPYTREGALAVLQQLHAHQRKFKREVGHNFIYPSDELYVLGEAALPNYESYDDFPQIENGVGLLRRFESGFRSELARKRPLKRRVVLRGATGACAHGFLTRLFEELIPYGIEIDLHRIRNDHFGETVTVAGLICGCDLVAQMKGGTKLPVLIPRCMMREQEAVFLDGMTIDQVKNGLQSDVYPMPYDDGEAFVDQLFERLEG